MLVRIYGFLSLSILCVGPLAWAQQHVKGSATVSQSAHFQCGDVLSPGVTYKRLAECYKQRNEDAEWFWSQYQTVADRYNALLEKSENLSAEYRRAIAAPQHVVLLDGKTYTDVAELGNKYNELANDYNRVADAYRSLNASFDQLSSACNQLSRLVSTPIAVPPYPTYDPPKRIYCNTVMGTTSCYEQ